MDEWSPPQRTTNSIIRLSSQVESFGLKVFISVLRTELNTVSEWPVGIGLPSLT